MRGGLIEGTTEAERIEKWGEGWRERDLGLETREEGASRGKAFIDQIVHDPADNVLVVSHGAILRHLLKALVPDLDVEERLDNTAVSVLHYENGTFTCERYNCTKHLQSQD